MKKMLIVFLLFAFIRTFAPEASTLMLLEGEILKDQRLLMAIIEVESKGNPDIINFNEQALGLLQIRPVMIDEINRILREQGKIKSFTLTDALDSTKAIEMYWIAQNYHNPANDVKRGCEVWNGKSKTNKYYKRIKKLI